MEIKELVTAISLKHKEQGIKIHSPATSKELFIFEKQIGFLLPADFREFYSLCNGFACDEDIFNITPLQEIADCGKNWFLFAEYMIFSDSWGLRFIDDAKYEIFYSNYDKAAIATSMNEFLERFLRGNVFDEGGLYDWLKELGIR
ncbi:MAG: SMI1/KNR4 family protein [Bacteroidota bacterium]